MNSKMINRRSIKRERKQGNCICWGSLSLVLSLLLITGLCFAFPGKALAAGPEDYDISVESSRDDARDTITVHATVSNAGGDFGGYVRIQLRNAHYNNIAYERYVAIAAGATDTVDITFPIPGNYDVDGVEMHVYLLDEARKEITEVEIRNPFESVENSFGVLSDDKSLLEYLEYNSGGYSLFSNVGSLVMSDQDLTQLSDVSQLSGLTLLVIDNYELAKLPEAGIDAIEEWTRAGGFLIIGTGESGGDTFEGFDSDFIDATYGGSAVRQDSYYGIDGELMLADIDWGDTYVMRGSDEFYVKKAGQGNVILLDFSLSSEDLDRYYVSSSLMETVRNHMNANSGKYELSTSDMERVFESSQGKGSVNLVLLRIVILLYVFLAGPILYLVLKKLNKREKIWAVLPVISLIFVLLVFLIGSGWGNSKRYFNTVRIQAADGSGMADLYIMGYDSANRSWDITLRDAYGGGPVASTYTYGANVERQDYQYCASASPAGFKFYYKPGDSFDEAYFRAMAENNETEGHILSDVEVINGGNLKGTIQNNTEHDFAYYLVKTGDSYAFAEGGDKGETVKVNEAPVTSAGNNKNAVYVLISRAQVSRDADEPNQGRYLAALALAAERLQRYDSFVVGVTKQEENMILSSVKEEGCLCVYEVQ